MEAFEIQNCFHAALEKGWKTEGKFKPYHPVSASRTSMNSLQHSWDRCCGKVHFQPSAVFVSMVERFYIGSFTTILVRLLCLSPSNLNLCRTLRTEKSKTEQPKIWALFKQKHEQSQQPSGPMVFVTELRGHILRRFCKSSHRSSQTIQVNICLWELKP